MRSQLLLLLLAGIAAAQDKQPKRTVAEVLADHAETLGDYARVKTLAATGSTNGQPAATYLRGGKCVRRVKNSTEYVGDAGVFIAMGGVFERYRPGLPAQRGMHYLLKALAEPFPMRPYLENPLARKGLRLGWTKQHEVLETQADTHGVVAQYMFDRRTHVLSMVRFQVQANQPVAVLKFEAHKRTSGILLPGAVRGVTWMSAENVDKKGLTSSVLRRTDQYLKWQINPDLQAMSFSVAGFGAGGAKGFERIELATGPEPHEAAVGDLDRDGLPDVAVACHGGVWVHFGGALTKPVKVPLGAWQHRGLVIEDLDRDGFPEIVTASRLHPPEFFYLVEFDAQRKPTVVKHAGAPHCVAGLVCVDLDQDGLGDLLSTGGAGDRRLDIKFSNGAGAFRVTGLKRPLSNKLQPNRRGFGLAVGHLDGDNLKDIVVADGKQLRVFQGKVNLAFAPSPAIPGGPRPVAPRFADLNGDGLQDLLVANDFVFKDQRGDVAILLNTGKGMKGHDKVETGARTPDIAVGRFDAGETIDLAAASYLTGEVTLLYGNGKGDLKGLERLRSGRGTHRLAVIDFNGDGKDDILASNRLDDTVVLFLNRRATLDKPQPRQARARVCKAVTDLKFRLEGLSDSYEFMAEFRLPGDIRDPSGIAWLGGDPAHRQFVFVSDKEPSLFRGVLDVERRRFLVGPRIPLTGKLPAGALDLEGTSFDHGSGNLFLACERGSLVLRATLFGHVLDGVKTGIENAANDGIEALALRRKKDGTPLLYVFKERFGKTLKQPPVQVLGVVEEPFELPLQLETTIPFPAPDQTGAALYGQRMYVVSRSLRTVFELFFEGRGFAKQHKRASFARLTDDMLGLISRYGVAEGLAMDARGDLYVLVDNNGEVMGKDGLNRGNEGRLLWFRNLGTPRGLPSPRRVVVRQIFIPWQGALGNPDVKRTREEAGKLAEECVRRAQRGEDFTALAEKYHHERQQHLPPRVTIERTPGRAKPGEFKPDGLPLAFSRLAFRLVVGEAGLCEFHRTESPYGWYVLMRVE